MVKVLQKKKILAQLFINLKKEKSYTNQKKNAIPSVQRPSSCFPLEKKIPFFNPSPHFLSRKKILGREIFFILILSSSSSLGRKPRGGSVWSCLQPFISVINYVYRSQSIWLIAANSHFRALKCRSQRIKKKEREKESYLDEFLEIWTFGIEKKRKRGIG